MYEAILYNIAVAYILLCKLNYGYHNLAHFINIFQAKHFFSCEICYGLWERYELSCDTKICKSMKKVDKIGLGP